MGLRVTNEKIIKVVEDVMTKFNREIVDALEKKICKAKSITIKENIAIYVQQKSKELGYVGFPRKIDAKVIKDIIKENFIPVVTPMGLDEKNQAYNINADVVAGTLATNLKSRRLLLMTDVEGVYDKNKRLISEINFLFLPKTPSTSVINNNLLDFKLTAKAPAAVSALIL